MTLTLTLTEEEATILMRCLTSDIAVEIDALTSFATLGEKMDRIERINTAIKLLVNLEEKFDNV